MDADTLREATQPGDSQWAATQSADDCDYHPDPDDYDFVGPARPGGNQLRTDGFEAEGDHPQIKPPFTMLQ